MSIGHHCGIALVRLLKSNKELSEKYSDPDLLLNLIYLMLLKQKNRGQDAAGIATLFSSNDRKVDQEYLYKDKLIAKEPVSELYESLIRTNPATGRRLVEERRGIAMIGHVLYSTLLSKLDYRYVHPVERTSHWPSKRIVIAMNGNFANNSEQRDYLKSIGQMITSSSDMETLVECFGYFLSQYHYFMKYKGHSEEDISKELSLVKVMRNVHKRLRGAYALTGMVGNGDVFVCRDPMGIRPVFIARNDEFFIAASEMSAIYSTFQGYGIKAKDIKELSPGEIIVIKSGGEVISEFFTKKRSSRPCMFEGVYFNRPNNRDTYHLRKRLGALLAHKVNGMLENLEDTIVSFIPNTSQSAAFGFYQELLRLENQKGMENLLKKQQSGKLEKSDFQEVLGSSLSFEQVLTKDVKFRTFITQKEKRNSLVTNAYDTVFDIAQVLPLKRVILVEDSVVKGTTLEKSVIRTLVKSGAQDIVIASTCPQIRYPCPYGVEMSRLNEFLSFRAALEVIKDNKLEDELERIEEKVRLQQLKIHNDLEYFAIDYAREVYALAGEDNISKKIGVMLRPKDLPWSGTINVVFLSVEELKEGMGLGESVDTACLDGTYPEIGGGRVLNMSLINFFDNSEALAY